LSYHNSHVLSDIENGVNQVRPNLVDILYRVIAEVIDVYIEV